MPSDAAYWLVSAPLKHGDDEDLFRSIKTIVPDDTVIGGLQLPHFKVGLRIPSATQPLADKYRTLLPFVLCWNNRLGPSQVC